MNACGYSQGARFTPRWMDPPMFYHGNNWEITPGMVFFAHMILADSPNEKAMAIGRTYIVADGGPETVSGHPVAFLAK